MSLTHYQSLIVKYFEAEYGYPICEVLRYFRDMPRRFEDIATQAGCSRQTLRSICEAVGFEGLGTWVVVDKRRGHCPNATDFLRSFDTIEDAVIHCRNELKLPIKETKKKLGISKATICRHTPDWSKYTFYLSKEGLEAKRRGVKKTQAYNRENHPWQSGKF